MPGTWLGFGILLVQIILLQQIFNEQLVWTSHCLRLLGDRVKNKMYFLPLKCVESGGGKFPEMC